MSWRDLLSPFPTVDFGLPPLPSLYFSGGAVVGAPGEHHDVSLSEAIESASAEECIVTASGHVVAARGVNVSSGDSSWQLIDGETTIRCNISMGQMTGMLQ